MWSVAEFDDWGYGAASITGPPILCTVAYNTSQVCCLEEQLKEFRALPDDT